MIFQTTKTSMVFKISQGICEGKENNGGEGGIRTLEALRPTHFPGVLLRPLGHLT